MSKDKVDIKGYSEMWTRPKRVFVKRLTHAHDYDIVVNGLPSTVTAPAGSFEVLLIRADGSLLRKTAFTEEQLRRKYGTAGIEGDLFANVTNEGDDDESGGEGDAP